MKMGLGTCLGIVGYSLYVQFSPQIGNIWYRYDSSGEKIFVFSNLKNLMCEPLKNGTFWRKENLDLNVFTWVGAGIGLSCLI